MVETTGTSQVTHFIVEYSNFFDTMFIFPSSIWLIYNLQVKTEHYVHKASLCKNCMEMYSRKEN
jgi:hypothetical protein